MALWLLHHTMNRPIAWMWRRDLDRFALAGTGADGTSTTS